jgi:hypothetical protein
MGKSLVQGNVLNGADAMVVSRQLSVISIQ